MCEWECAIDPGNSYIIWIGNGNEWKDNCIDRVSRGLYKCGILFTHFSCTNPWCMYHVKSKVIYLIIHP